MGLPRGQNVHIRWELAQRLVKVVHLGQYADHGNNHEHVGGGVAELVVARKGQLQGNAERLNSHDRDRADGRADAQVDERVPLAVHGTDTVDHDARKNADSECVEQKA